MGQTVSMTNGVPDSREVLGDLIRLLDAAYDLRRQIDTWARDSYGLPLSQLMTVLALSQMGGAANVSQIAREVGRKSHTITVVVDTLEQKGYVTRARSNDGDRRTVTVRLTSAGKACVTASAPEDRLTSLPVSGDEHAQVQEVADLLERLCEPKAMRA